MIFWMENVVLIKWFEKFKVTAQGGLAHGKEGVGYPQMMKIDI